MSRYTAEIYYIANETMHYIYSNGSESVRVNTHGAE